MRGGALIVAAIILFNSETRFPGTAALLPVAGSALVIAYGEGTATARLLSLRPLTFIGLISYSLYLWHWPLIVFGRDLGLLDGKIGPAVAIVLMSIAAGYLSYRFVETPFRNRSLFSRQRIYRLATVGAAVLLGWGFFYQYSNGLRSRFSSPILAFDDGQYDFSPRRDDCLAVIGTADPAHACVFGGESANMALWGIATASNSQSRSVAPSILCGPSPIPHARPRLVSTNRAGPTARCTMISSPVT